MDTLSKHTKIKQALRAIVLSALVPGTFLLLIALGPKVISESLAVFAIQPVLHLFGEERLWDLSLVIYGRVRVNLAAILLHLSIAFWFLFPLLCISVFYYFRGREKSNHSS